MNIKMYIQVLILIFITVLILILNKTKEHFIVSGERQGALELPKIIDTAIVEAYNADIKENVQSTINSQNIDIDKKIINILQSFNNIIIAETAPIVNIPDIRGNNTTLVVNEDEINFIVNNFIAYINSKTGYTFDALDRAKTEVNGAIVNGEIIKKYSMYLYIFESTIAYTKRLVVSFVTKQYTTKKGTLMISQVIIPADARIEQRPILPPAEKSVRINTITEDILYADVENKPKYSLVDITDIKLENERRQFVEQIRKEYGCYGVPQNELINDKLQCINFGGVWDRPPQDNTECPYYLANKNYLNERGGAKNDYCEMPQGIQIMGYTQYKEKPEDFQPQCYNCKDKLIGQGTVGLCCEDQRTNKLKYPSLKSPDYRFSGDFLDRQNNQTDLIALNLSVT